MKNTYIFTRSILIKQPSQSDADYVTNLQRKKIMNPKIDYETRIKSTVFPENIFTNQIKNHTEKEASYH